MDHVPSKQTGLGYRIRLNCFALVSFVHGGVAADKDPLAKGLSSALAAVMEGWESDILHYVVRSILILWCSSAAIVCAAERKAKCRP